GCPSRSVRPPLTSSKEAERLLARSNRALKMLSECNEVMTRATGEQELLSQICRLAVEKGGYRMAWVGYAQQDEGKTIKPMAFAGEEQGYLSEIVLTWQSSDPRGWGPGGQVIRSGRLVFAEDILDTSSGFHWVEPAVRRGYRSVICLPLKEGQHTFGMLALYTGEVQRTGPEELKLLQDLADDLAYGIQHLRSQDERRRMETAVLKIAASVSASIGTVFFKQLARNMAEALGAHASFVAKLLPGEPARARTMAAVVDGKVNADFEFTLKGKPAEHLLEEGAWVVPARVVERYPEADMLRELRAEAYVGCRLVDASGMPVGLLFVIFQEPIEKADFINTTLKIFAARAAAELERQDSDRRIRQQASLLDKARDAILVRDLNNHILFWSKGAERIYGWRADEVMGRDVATVLYRDTAGLRVAMTRVMETGEWSGELHHFSKDGDRLIIEGRWTLLRDNDGQPQSILAINTDITDKKKLEQQFLRAQRMESIGTLAGGIAHDLNNVLSPITMAIDLLKLSVTGEMNQELLATVADSARRGAEMVRQVLSFARGMDGQRILIQVRHLVKDLEKIIRDTFPKSINLRMRLDPDLMPLLGDATQLHQVLLNLCVNSRDAMPGGGEITITAQNVRLTPQEAARHLDAHAGQYVRVQVKDNGVGIPPAVIDKVFDPFFTTKEVGKGTGLGLSTSLAIVKGHEGFIRLDSNEGGGTIFEIYLPACPEENPALEDKRVLDCPRGAGECVLVVDDEEMIRRIARQTLLAYEYKVLLAADGMEALATYLKNRDQIAVVITDMMMPVMDGAATIKGLMAINPLVKIIAASGITANDQLARASGVGVKQFLAKPYSVESLLIALRQTIHETPG
ncbi:MAG: ATP-binding protein, partial [Verrucomicrobium sp.]